MPAVQGEVKNAARKKLAAPGSKLHEWLGKIDAKLGANPSGFAVGDTLTMADLRCFCELSSMISGWYDGIPAALLSAYSNIQTHRAKIASLPEVEKYYSAAGPNRTAFKPFDPAAAAAGATPPGIPSGTRSSTGCPGIARAPSPRPRR